LDSAAAVVIVPKMQFRLRSIWVFGLVAVHVICGARPTNEFFAMDTIARGDAETATRLVEQTGFAGVGGQALDVAMPRTIAAHGLTFYSGYLVMSFTPQPTTSREALVAWYRAIAPLRPALWLAIEKVSDAAGKPLPFDDARANDIVTARLREMADDARPFGVRVSLYHHTGYWMNRFEQSLSLLRAVDRDNVGATFNLCHWLKVEGSKADPRPLIRGALPHLQFVTINGADDGETQSMNWDRLIQPLDQGSYDVRPFVREVVKTGYEGPVGLQGYGIVGEPDDVMARAMKVWDAIDVDR
jgi:sugar phosphate isomerase/epimerase